MMAITKREHGHNGHASDFHSISLPQCEEALQTLVHWIHHPSLAFIFKAPLSSMLVIACPPPHTWLSPFVLSPYKLLSHLCLWFLVQLLILDWFPLLYPRNKNKFYASKTRDDHHRAESGEPIHTCTLHFKVSTSHLLG